MLIKRLLFAFILTIFSTSIAKAQSIAFDLNLFYFTDELSLDDKDSSDRTFYTVFLGFIVDRDARYHIGWNYATYQTTDKISDVENKYSSTQMGPSFVMYLNRARSWRLGLSYNLITTGKFEGNGDPEVEWRGTGLAVELGYRYRMGERSSIGLSLNYSSTSYNEEFIDTTKEDVSYSRTHIYPSIAMGFEF